jgi:hypothetical protein
MDRLGSSHKARDGQNVQGRRAKDTHTTLRDAKTEQTPPESRMRQAGHFLKKAVFYTTVATTVVDSTISPAFAKGLSNNDQRVLSMRDDRHTRLSQKGVSHYSLEPGRGSSSVDSPSEYMGRDHGEFSLMVRIGDHEFVKPTAEDIKALLQDKKFPEYLKMLCKKPQNFVKLLKNEAFLDMIDPMYQDENVLHFMQSLCENPGLQPDFLKLKEVVSNNIIEKRVDALFKRMGAMSEPMDAIRNRLGNDDEYDKKRETDHLTIHKKQQYQEYGTVFIQMMHGMQGLMHKMLDQQHEKDKVWMTQDTREKERLFDFRERERERSRKTHEQSGDLALGAVATVATIGAAYFIAKCVNQRSEHRERIAYLRAQMARDEREYRLQEEQQFRYRQDSHQIEYRSDQRVKVEEIEDEKSKAEYKGQQMQRHSYGKEDRKYEEENLKNSIRKSFEILNDKKLLLELFKNGKNEHINKLFLDCGSKNVLQKILELKKGKKSIFQNEQFQKSLLNDESALSYLHDSGVLKKVERYGSEEFKQKVIDAMLN